MTVMRANHYTKQEMKTLTTKLDLIILGTRFSTPTLLRPISSVQILKISFHKILNSKRKTTTLKMSTVSARSDKSGQENSRVRPSTSTKQQ